MHAVSKHTIGMVPGAKRTVTPVPESLLALVPPPTDNNRTIKSGMPDVEADTMPLIINKAKRTQWQVKKLAATFKASSLPQTLQNISNFILRHIAYKQDATGHEEVRSPRRLVYDGIGDCDCYAVFVAACLLQLGIKFRFRLANYSGTDWTHIYIVIAKDQQSNKPLDNRSDYYVIDPVTNAHNHEVPFNKKRDYTMALKFLDGIGTGMLAGCSDAEKKPLITRLRRYVDARQVVEAGLVPTRVFLSENKIPFTEGYDADRETGYFVVDTPAGKAAVSTMLTPDEAATLMPLAPATKLPTRMEAIAALDVARAEVTGKLQPVLQQVEQQAMQAAEVITEKAKEQKSNWGWWLLALAGGYLILKPKKKAATTLSGVKPKPVKTIARL